MVTFLLQGNSEYIFYIFLIRDEMSPIAFDDFSNTNGLKCFEEKKKTIYQYSLYFLQSKMSLQK